MVVLAGLINSLKLRKSLKDEVKIVINGAGAAGTAIAKLLLSYGLKNIIVCDSKGIIYKGRKEMNSEKEKLALITNLDNKPGKLEDAVIGTDVFVGVSTGNVLNEKMIKSMNDNPIIFALANPRPEIMPDRAKKAGAFIVATGRSDFPNQVNNVLAFPGIFRGLIDNKIKQITDSMLVKAAEAIAGSVNKVSRNVILPNPLDKKIFKAISKVII